MAVLNPPSALPGLARSITNHLLTSRASYTGDRLIALFAPSGISNIQDRTRGVDNTLKAARAIGLLTEDTSGVIRLPEDVLAEAKRSGFTRAEFRQLLRHLVFNIKRDGNPWAADADARTWTTGARDLSRALSWFLAQDAFGAALSWTGKGPHNAQELQSAQLHHVRKDDRPFSNDTRWNALSRWAMAMGLAEPGPITTSAGLIGAGLVPLPVRAVRDVVSGMMPGRRPVASFLGELSNALPVLEGGIARRGLQDLVDEDPDPGVRAGMIDTSVSQSLLLLEEQGLISLTYGSDAEAHIIADSQSGSKINKRVTNIEVLGGGNRDLA